MSDVQKMDPEVKPKWIEALRSGNYGQGKARLLDSKNDYCCLGVLAEVNKVKREHNEFVFDGHCRNVNHPDDRVFKSNYIVPADYAGISMPQLRVLMDKNDQGVPFNEIADYIEANL